MKFEFPPQLSACIFSCLDTPQTRGTIRPVNITQYKHSTLICSTHRRTYRQALREQKEKLMLTRRKTLQLTASAIAMPFVSRLGWAQSYPSRPVRLVVGFPAGGVADLFARLVGQSLSERLGQPFIIENRVGAGSNLATEGVV